MRHGACARALATKESAALFGWRRRSRLVQWPLAPSSAPVREPRRRRRLVSALFKTSSLRPSLLWSGLVRSGPAWPIGSSRTPSNFLRALHLSAGHFAARAKSLGVAPATRLAAPAGRSVNQRAGVRRRKCRTCNSTLAARVKLRGPPELCFVFWPPNSTDERTFAGAATSSPQPSQVRSHSQRISPGRLDERAEVRSDPNCVELLSMPQSRSSDCNRHPQCARKVMRRRWQQSHNLSPQMSTKRCTSRLGLSGQPIW